MVETHREIVLGRRLRETVLEGLRLVEAVHEPGLVMPAHAHDSANLTLVFAGEFDERLGAAGVRARPASLVVKPRGTVHANRYGGRPTRSFLIEVERGRERELGLSAAGPGRWCHGGRAVAAFVEVYRAFRGQAADLERTALSAAREIVARSPADGAGEPVGPRPTSALLRATELLRASLATPPSSAELAARVGVHPVYLARLFRRRHGCGIAGFRRRLQVQDAARRLAESPQPLAEVALASGFSDQSHLCRVFRDELGLPPGAFRSAVAR
ncbi:MAG: AraC family transcriptional regulator [Planctomycetota bacterium]